MKIQMAVFRKPNNNKTNKTAASTSQLPLVNIKKKPPKSLPSPSDVLLVKTKNTIESKAAMTVAEELQQLEDSRYVCFACKTIRE